MATAEVGDDNSHEDPTVLRLEAMAAERFGREDALFVASGTMGNLVSVLAQTSHGDEIILGDASHHFVYEVGGAAAIGGLSLRTLSNDRFGMLELEAIRAAVRPDNVHFPRTSLLAIENTHNLRGGTVLSLGQIGQLVAVGREAGLRVHLDGSRIFNAAAALGVPVAEAAGNVDSLTFCLSKGLAAPVGSMVVGSRAFIADARKKRKLLGGTMRQAGVIAAAGVVALEQMVERLPEDHAVAWRLAQGMAELPGLDVDLATVQTNLVFANTTGRRSALEIAADLADGGIRVNVFTPTSFRLATHYCVDMDDAERMLLRLREILAA
jgi:threonine aldolase